MDRLYFPTSGWSSRVAYSYSPAENYNKLIANFVLAHSFGDYVINSKLSHQRSPSGELPAPMMPERSAVSLTFPVIRPINWWVTTSPTAMSVLKNYLTTCRWVCATCVWASLWKPVKSPILYRNRADRLDHLGRGLTLVERRRWGRCIWAMGARTRALPVFIYSWERHNPAANSRGK